MFFIFTKNRNIIALKSYYLFVNVCINIDSQVVEDIV